MGKHNYGLRDKVTKNGKWARYDLGYSRSTTKSAQFFLYAKQGECATWRKSDQQYLKKWCRDMECLFRSSLIAMVGSCPNSGNLFKKLLELS
ncbi:hypothetical protein Tco_1183610 [Tanacetum coccineum]